MTMLGSGSLEVAKTSTLDPVFYSTRPGYNVVSLNMSQVPTSYYTLSAPNDYGIHSLTPHQGTTWNVGIYLKNGSSSTASSILVKNETWNIALPIDEGVYFLNNVEYPNKYVQINNNNSMFNSGEIIELHQFCGHSYQRWEIEHVLDGYYKIISQYSGLELTAPTGANNDVVTQTTPSSANTHLWKFIKQLNGTYRISPKSNSNYFMAAGNESSAADQDLEIRTTQSNSSDEWRLCRQDLNTVTLEVIYDGGYLSRYSNATTRIEAELLVLQEKFLREFDIWINYSSPTSYISYGDQCSTNHSTICQHARNFQCCSSTSPNNLYSYHHKNVKNIFYRMPLPNVSTTTCVLYTGHDTCGEIIDENGEYIEHLPKPIYGIASKTIGCAMIMNFENVFQEMKTLTHEFGHLYGTIDHYGGGNNKKTTDQLDAEYPNQGYSEYCIYGEQKDFVAVYQNLVICDGCKERIKENKDKYDHS